MPALLPCPVCSSFGHPLVPTWSGAHRTSERRGVRCAILTGCRHVDAIAQHQITEMPQAADLIARWNAEAERLVAYRTAGWTDAQRAAFRKSVGLPEAIAAQPSTTAPA